MSSKFGTKINVDAVIGCLPKKHMKTMQPTICL